MSMYYRQDTFSKPDHIHFEGQITELWVDNGFKTAILKVLHGNNDFGFSTGDKKVFKFYSCIYRNIAETDVTVESKLMEQLIQKYDFDGEIEDLLGKKLYFTYAVTPLDADPTEYEFEFLAVEPIDSLSTSYFDLKRPLQSSEFTGQVEDVHVTDEGFGILMKIPNERIPGKTPEPLLKFFWIPEEEYWDVDGLLTLYNYASKDREMCDIEELKSRTVTIEVLNPYRTVDNYGSVYKYKEYVNKVCAIE